MLSNHGYTVDSVRRLLHLQDVVHVILSRVIGVLSLSYDRGYSPRRSQAASSQVAGSLFYIRHSL